MKPSPEPRKSPWKRTDVRVEGHERQSLSQGWQAACTPPGQCSDTSGHDALSWQPARVPGTAAAVLHDAGMWRPGESYDFDAEDWWFRTSFSAPPAAPGEEVVLCLDGIATVAEVHLNGACLASSDSMFASHRLDVGGLLGEKNELAIHCRALGPLLRERRSPRARWRTRMVSEGNLRFFRTMLLGRAPGSAPGPAAVGPWGDVFLERRRRIAVDRLALRASVDGTEGRLAVRACLRSLQSAAPSSIEVELSDGGRSWRAPLAITNRHDGIEATGQLRVPDAALWWPHTHGEPALYEARLIVSGPSEVIAVDAGRVGFRSLAFGATAGHDVQDDGLDLHINGVRVFARGCVWTPVDAVGLAPSSTAVRAALQQVCDAGMNLVRIPGTSVYENAAFHDLCDELGVLVWQDFMFANLDYPICSDTFRATVTREAVGVLSDLAGRPSLVVLCGNSEVEQQVAMLGLDPALGRGELFGELLPSLVRESGIDAAYVPSAPCGGELPFRTDRGVCNYFGVGAYRRPLEDARRAEVRFASECLAFSNVPDAAAIDELRLGAPGDGAWQNALWKAGVPRDAGAAWDFEDVRDHYLGQLFDLEPAELRERDRDRYLELSRTVTGEVMAEVFGEWRRSRSPCHGGLVLWLRDLMPGAGWGVIDSRGEPKVAYHHLRRALAPIAVWTTDEGLNGVVAHVANDRPARLRAQLRIAVYRDLEIPVHEATETLELAPHGSCERDLEHLIGHFADVAFAYRFGPPGHDLLVASLERASADGTELISQSLRFPAGRPREVESAKRLALHATAHELENGDVRLAMYSKRFVYGVRVNVPGFLPSDDAFSIEPGAHRSLLLRGRQPGALFSGGALTALNLDGAVQIAPVQIDPLQIDPVQIDPVQIAPVQIAPASRT